MKAEAHDLQLKTRDLAGIAMALDDGLAVGLAPRDTHWALANAFSAAADALVAYLEAVDSDVPAP
jgi:hypothetical protein